MGGLVTRMHDCPDTEWDFMGDYCCSCGVTGFALSSKRRFKEWKRGVFGGSINRRRCKHGRQHR